MRGYSDQWVDQSRNKRGNDRRFSIHTEWESTWPDSYTEVSWTKPTSLRVLYRVTTTCTGDAHTQTMFWRFAHTDTGTLLQTSRLFTLRKPWFSAHTRIGSCMTLERGMRTLAAGRGAAMGTLYSGRGRTTNQFRFWRKHRLFREDNLETLSAEAKEMGTFTFDWSSSHLQAFSGSSFDLSALFLD